LKQLSLRAGACFSLLGVFGAAFLWLLSFKVIAYWVGPEGVGLFSQFRQIAQAATIGATFGGTNSVVQGLAERVSSEERLQFRATAFRYIALMGLAWVLVLVVMAPYLTLFLLSSKDPALVSSLRWIGLAVLLNVGATYAIAVFTGYRSYQYLAMAQIVGPLSLFVLLFGAWSLRLSLSPQLLSVSFVVCFGITFLVGVFGLSRLPEKRIHLSAQVLPKAQASAFIRFAASNLFAALSATFTLLMIRSWVIQAKGLAFAGLFDAGWTLTFNYTTIFLTACSAIYLPLLTAATTRESQWACMLKTAYLVLGASTVICYVLVLLKVSLINLLYSTQFHESGEVLMVLVIAVIFRGVSWVYGAMILATRKSRVLLVSDLALNLFLLGTAYFAINVFGTLTALSWAFVLPNLLYLVFVVEYACLKNRLMRRRQIWPFLLAATFPLCYLALTSSGIGQQLPYAEVTKWFCMAIGLVVSATMFRAFKKVVL
jgi:O-antigen/teichoic acid export membrane protein